MKKTVKKLVLAKETVRGLESVAGGLINQNSWAAWCQYPDSWGPACGTFSDNDSICC